MSNFVQDCLTGNALLEDIDNYIDQWHESDSPEPIHSFLGMSRDEYAAWINMPDILPYIVTAKKENIKYTEALQRAASMAARSNTISKQHQIEIWLREHNFDV